MGNSSEVVNAPRYHQKFEAIIASDGFRNNLDRKAQALIE
jgi:hypothetical protein